MEENPQKRFEETLALDARVDSPGREGLTGTAPANLYASIERREQLSVPPDFRPMAEQPQWRKDFAIDWPEDSYVARRDFVKFLVLTSGAFVAGQAWITAQNLVRARRPKPERLRVAGVSSLAPGSVLSFNYPGEHDPCVLVRLPDGELVAFSQKCTHLSCAVVPRVAEGVFHCPCHEGYFDLRTGRNIAGPPPRPLPRIDLEIDGDDVFAIGVASGAV